MKKSKPVKQNRRLRNILLAAIGLSVVGGLYLATRKEQGSVEPLKPAEPQVAQAAQPSGTPAAANRVPPYHESAKAAKPFPQLLPAAYFSNNPLVARAYRAAADIPEVAAQQPCYCYCDKYGHKSLLDCYASDHAAG